MPLQYRVTPLPEPWPGTATPGAERTSPQFKTIWGRALELLEREVGYLDGRNVEIALDVGARDLRTDGQLRADARPRSPGVVVSFETPSGRMTFAADQYTYWQENVDAVARSLEKLRAVDRYGVLQGRQYEGFRALPAQTSAGLPPLEAARAIALAALMDADAAAPALLRDAEATARAVRAAQRRTHPDAGGRPEDFDLVQRAASVLKAHHGGAR